GIGSGENPGIVLVGIVLDMFARGTVHLCIGRRSNVESHLLRKRQQHAVLDNLGVESSFTEFLCDVLRSLAILGRTSNMRRLRQDAQVLFSQTWIRRLIEFVVDFRLAREIAESKDLFATGALRRLAKTG